MLFYSLLSVDGEEELGVKSFRPDIKEV